MSKAKTTKDDQRSESQAKAQLDSIREMVQRLNHCQECDGEECDLTPKQLMDGLGIWMKGKPKKSDIEEWRRDYHDREAAEQRIQEDPLCVELRSGWYTPGSEPEPEEYTILLCTGGPACRIIGDLDERGDPRTARIEHQDWFTPWTEYRMDSEEESDVVTYARQFMFSC